MHNIDTFNKDIFFSNLLKNLIIKDIYKKNGWISFKRYMELALYAKNLGYYNNNSIKFGENGDFITAPEISSFFGITLTKLAIEIFEQTEPIIMEFGSGNGKLAKDILTAFNLFNIKLEKYIIIELSPKLRNRQKKMLIDFTNIEWLNNCPKNFSGLIILNEVLDAMPVSLVTKGINCWYERGVTWINNKKNGKFIFKDRPCSLNFIKQITNEKLLPIGYLTEIHSVAIKFIASLAKTLINKKNNQSKNNSILILLIDYGFPSNEYYLDQRSQGTLMCHYKHNINFDPFYLPGLQDITAHIDFTAIAKIATDNGLNLLNYTSQSGFLINSGICNILSKFMFKNKNNIIQHLQQINGIKKLISLGEMGELFKILVLGHNIKWPKKFLQYDRSHRL
ncbi:class I SAM-dependent methyltransferase [Candidatus Profftella armatura (Diaphorina cf. continua)]|uniref:Class I SAM-dependent methyltransferase n=1 Tax=Candidatus Profftella armatura (Diaphorina cf. continua) TaxID=2661583 RepID=A0A7R6W048_9PROT|nr:SAM-dependent methyltransferase [Candidatus Profftella armatura (Diaphorina cf. continua)]BCG49663.1 class I SAM-dependent methyltransferase [Candidatus Profftella armatura (Diaphorina cf. continua)]